MKNLSTGADTSSSPIRLLIYAHFDPANVIQEYVLHTLRSMSAVCQEIRFVTTSVLPEGELAKIRSYVHESQEVENIGLDFYMWKCSLQKVNLHEYDELVIMNSSVHGPLFDISPIFASMQDTACDCWGMTESYELDWHLQSYFIVFRKAVLVSEAFRHFWDSVLPYKSKKQIIRSYEIGLSQWLADHGFAMQAYCSWKRLVRYLFAHPQKSWITPKNLPVMTRIYKQTTRCILNSLHLVHIRPVNPTVAYPEELIKLGVPFLKLEVLRDNPLNRDVDSIMSVLNALNYQREYLLTDRSAISTGGMITSRSSICPLCGNVGNILHSGLSDRFVVNSLTCWNIRQCCSHDCGSAWLDPAPLESEVYKAYRTYFTHQGPAESLEYYPQEYSYADGIILKIARRCLNYLNTHTKRQIYWLHGLGKGQGHLLEVGCGEGSRLAALKEFGWNVEGQEVDPEAVRICHSKGLVVHEGYIEQLSLAEGAYDVILMSHVIEHVHHPVQFLTHCRKLLKPGGRVVLSTPNIESFGHWMYRNNWLPLDPPRHIVLHSRRSLTNILKKAGFSRVFLKTVALNCELIAMHSRDIKYFGCTDMYSLPRVGNEVIPVVMQLAALMVHYVAPGSGEEYYAVAEKDE